MKIRINPQRNNKYSLEVFLRSCFEERIASFIPLHDIHLNSTTY